jgi:ZIP family zinc transporter
VERKALRTNKYDGGARGLFVTVGVDILIDGLLISAAFAAGTEEGIIVTIALTIKLLFLGLAVTVEMAETTSKTVRIDTIVGLAVILLLGS